MTDDVVLKVTDVVAKSWAVRGEAKSLGMDPFAVAKAQAVFATDEADWPRVALASAVIAFLKANGAPRWKDEETVVWSRDQFYVNSVVSGGWLLNRWGWVVVERYRCVWVEEHVGEWCDGVQGAGHCG
jgi:hypothetical protein